MYEKLKLKTILLGLLIGILLPIIGLFVGLQVSTIAGTILAFPIVLVVIITGIPLGQSPIIVMAGILLSILLWIALVHVIATYIKSN